MPLTVKFRDIDKDILEAICCGQYMNSSNLEPETGDSDEGNEDEDSLDDSDFESTTMP